MVKQRIKKFIATTLKKSPKFRMLDKSLNLQANILSQLNLRKNKIESFEDVEFSVYSQWGEDGILDWLLSRLNNIPKTFIEFGVQNYWESNTRYLLQKRCWDGLVIDSAAENIKDIKKQEVYWRNNLKAICEFITEDNINDLVEENGFKGNIGLLSIDIDGNDFWIWKKIKSVNAAIVVIEYNAVMGDLEELTIPYKKDFERGKKNFSNLYFGASLPALLKLAMLKGYTFLGTNSSGVNAFFLRNDLSAVLSPHIEVPWGYPSKHRESRDRQGRLIFVEGTDRLDLIANETVVNPFTMEKSLISGFEQLYSSYWTNGQRRKF